MYSRRWFMDAAIREAILERDFQAIGIKLDIQNYPAETFFRLSSCLAGRRRRPQEPMAGRYDIAEFENTWYWL